MPANYELHCGGCPYYEAAHLPADFRRIRTAPLSMENNRASVLLVFQAPGIEEWTAGKPVISANPSSAGVRLEAAFHIAHRTRQHYNITNTVQCFPGKNLQTGITKTRDNTPPASARQHCYEWLRQDIEGWPYERIIVFGKHAEKSVRELGYEKDLRFHFVRHPTGGISNEALAKALG